MGHELWLSMCEKIGFSPVPRKYQEGTRTSQDAADQLGCNVSHIAKSIVFQGPEGAVVVITSGSNKVDRKKKLKGILGFKPGMATPDYVLQQTGYVVGGVPPFGHTSQAEILMDEDLLKYDLVWGAAGSRQTVFPITPEDLKSISGAKIVDVKQ